MTDRLAHRGPDGSGLHVEPGVALGHRRLSVIDLESGTQPLSNEDGTVWVVFNGEIYNFPSLRTELERSGHRFRTRTDTEVLVHLYEEMGPNLVDRLRGMFAFAIWDSRTRTLLLARDRLGKKPLVYWQDTDGLRFASELKSLVVEDRFSRDIDPIALDDYLTYQYIPHPRTIYKAARKLPPAHRAIWRDGRLTVERYWTPNYASESNRSWLDDRTLVRDTLTEATRIRMIADVPIGAFLSGGIDSTIVVGLMQSLSSQPVKTFSIGFPVPEYDESKYARLAAEHLGTDHHEFHVQPDAVGIAHDLARFHDEPFGDSSAIPTYYVSKMARQDVTVALTGDGGDELFLGYERYRGVRIAEAFDRLPELARRLAAAKLWQRIPSPGMQKSRLRQAKRLLETLSADPRARYRRLVSIFSPERRADLYTPELARAIHGHDSGGWVESLYDLLPERDFLTQTSFVDLQTYLPGDILTKVDIASMASGLECRCPLLDHEFVDLVAGMPVDRKMRGGMTKVMLREAFADLLPPAIRRRGKMGFGVPLDHWFRSSQADSLRDILFSDRAVRRGWFQPSVVQRLVEEHSGGRWDHSHRLWTLVMLELWAETYLDGSAC